MSTVNLQALQTQIANLKAAGAPQIDPTGWQKLTEDFQHLVAEIKSAQLENSAGGTKISITEAIQLMMDVATIAGDVAGLAGQLFQKQAADATANVATSVAQASV